MPRSLLLTLSALASVLFILAWQGLYWGLRAAEARSSAGNIDVIGWVGLFVIGLVWTVYLLQRLDQRYERERVDEELALGGDRINDVLVSVGGEVCRSRRKIWNPFDLGAWYYGTNAQRLKQSIVSLFVYFAVFYVVYLAVTSRATAGVDPYDLPAGGGQEMMAQQQQVQIKKVVRKKYIINQFSTVKFAPPPIDQIDMKFEEIVRNEYVVGQGNDGTGNLGAGGGDTPGWGGGKGFGQVRFLRLVHSDRFWDKNFGIGGDVNMLAEYGSRSRQKVKEETEAISFDQLKAFPFKRSPPLIYVCGAQKFTLSASEQKILRDFIFEKHGMILGDSLGPGFHQQFVAAMNQITGTTPVPIARDDRIHLGPYRLPNLPIVVAHGGTVALGWKVDGRWVAYSHPGALSDAWRDDHAGIRKDIYEMCYQLGVNIIYYAHREYNQWLTSQQ